MPGNNNIIPLTNVSTSQIDKIHRKLQLIAPQDYDLDGRIELLKSSVIYNNGLSEYNDDDIQVIFKNGDFVDFKTTDDSFEGLFPKNKSGKVLFPCQVCAGEVTDKSDSSGLGIECDGCGMFFHNSCTSKPLSKPQFDAITKSPGYVKVLCPPCNRVYGSAALKLRRIEKKVTKTANTINLMSDQLEDIVSVTSKPSYSEVISKSSKANHQNALLPTNLVESLHTMTKATRDSQNADKLKRTRVAVRPGDTNIRTSRDIRKEFNKHHKGLVIKHCRLTASGSITFEFEDETTAKTVHSSWSTDFFGGNKGMKIPGADNTTGIVKHVYDDLPEEQMKDAIMNNYSEDIEGCEFLKRKGDDSFMGLIKVEFKSRDSLLKVMDEKIKFCNQRYIVEEYKRKSRVIKCNKCQGWGHVHRYCNKSAKCGKCAGNHESLSCDITTGFKCAHCNKDHKAGSFDCEVYKNKLAQFSVNRQYE